MRRIRGFREQVDALCTGTPTLAKGRWLCPIDHQRLLDDVEWTLIEMPLPKLQRVGGHDTHWLYRINWDDKAERPRRGLIRKYQRGERVGFDNMIRFRPGVAEAFVRLAGILRPFVLQHWAAKVAALNQLETDDLSNFLFGAERIALDAVRRPLIELQSGDCFYCGDRLRTRADVDHFIPWVRRPDNSLHNLVAAHPRCNNAKRDFLAASDHLVRWRDRSVRRDRELRDLAKDRAVAAALHSDVTLAGATALPRRKGQAHCRSRAQAPALDCVYVPRRVGVALAGKGIPSNPDSSALRSYTLAGTLTPGFIGSALVHHLLGL